MLLKCDLFPETETGSNHCADGGVPVELAVCTVCSSLSTVLFDGSQQISVIVCIKGMIDDLRVQLVLYTSQERDKSLH